MLSANWSNAVYLRDESEPRYEFDVQYAKKLSGKDDWANRREE